MTGLGPGHWQRAALLGPLLWLVATACSAWDDAVPSAPPAPVPVAGSPAVTSPTYTHEEVVAIMEAEERKPKFVGHFAGFEFGVKHGHEELGCQEFLTEVPFTELGQSQLQIDSNSLPDGVKKISEMADQCHGIVRSHAWEYDWPGHGGVHIVRFTSNIVGVTAPMERIAEVSVGGKTAVLITGLPAVGGSKDPQVGQFTLILPEDFGQTRVIGRGIHLDDLLELAERLRGAAPPAPSTSIYTAEEVLRLIEEDDRKPKFAGDFAGLHFSPHFGAADLGCDGFMDEVALAELGQSPLQITPGYVPTGFEKVTEAASECDGVVRSQAWLYFGPAHAEINISRYTSTTTLSVAPAERIIEVALGDRTAVLITGLPLPGQPRNLDVHPFRLYVLEDFGHTVIETRHVRLAELLKFAEGLR